MGGNTPPSLPFDKNPPAYEEGRPSSGKFPPHGKMATQMMKSLFLIVLLASSLGTAAAQERKARENVHVFFYTDCCGSAYGICNTQMTVPQAVHSLTMYFASHGYATVIREQISHFIKADVYSGKTYVDTVILDMKTGKIRSIY